MHPFPLLTVWAISLLTSARAVQETPTDDGPSMAERLAEIARTTADEHPWLGDRSVRELRTQLAQSLPAPARVKLLEQLAEEALRIGETAESIAAAQEGLRLLPPATGPSIQARRRALNDVMQLAWLRQGEDQNCVASCVCEACLFPFRPGGVHTVTEPATQALALQLAALKSQPNNARMQWLANLTARALGTPEAIPEAWRLDDACFASDRSFPALHNAAAEVGLDHFSLSGGVVLEDFDGDLDLDVLTSSFDPRVPLRFLRNEAGSFVDASAGSGLETILGGLNLVPADYDEDGDVDVLVLRGAWLDRSGRHPNSLVRNDGDGTFTDVTLEAGMADACFPTQTAAWADVEGDGDLDLYIGAECKKGSPWASQLWLNQGDGTFVEGAAEAGVADADRITKGVVFGDIDDDGDPDLFVSNLGSRNRLYRNDGTGKFVDIAPRTALVQPKRSFPAWFWDVNDDGRLDLFVASYDTSFRALVARVQGVRTDEAVPAKLFLGDGQGGFRDAATAWGLADIHPTMGANFGDLDSDGRLDVYLGTGFPTYDALMPNQLFVQSVGENGRRRFDDVTTASGTGHLQKGHGVAFADLDGDYDVDLFAQMGGAYPGDGFRDAWFQNPGNDHHLLKVRLVGTTTNRSALGARVHVVLDESEGARSIYRWVGSGGSFGANPLLCEIGCGRASRVERLEIRWPTSGTTQVFTDVATDQHIRITEGSDEVVVLGSRSTDETREETH